MRPAVKQVEKTASPAVYEQPTLKFVDEHAAAEILDSSVGTLRNWRWRGRGPAFYKFEGAVRYELGELYDYARSRRRTSTTEAA
jgi:hypothetical protein